jgi:glycerol kinase
VGTTGIKALVFDDTLSLLARAGTEMTKETYAGGRVEQDPLFLLEQAKKVLSEVMKAPGVHKEHIVNVGITNQRETVIAWHGETGEPLYPAIVWEDTRTAFLCRLLRLRGKNALVQKKTGLPLIPYFSASKIKWLLKNVPEAKKLLSEKKLRIGTVDSWLLWHLTEEKTFATDQTNASRTLLYNIKDLLWDNELLGLFGLKGLQDSALAQVRPPRANYGHLRADLLGISAPITAVCGDQQASTFAAMDNYQDGQRTTKITFGTGAFLVQVIGDKFQLCPPFFTTVIPNPKGDSPLYALEAKVGDCASRVSPAIGNQKKIEAVFETLVQEMEPYIDQLPVHPKELILDGGATQNPALARIEREVSGIPTRLQTIYDGTALGIAKMLKGNGE